MLFLKKFTFLCLVLISLPIFAEGKIIQAGTVLNLMQGIYTGSTTFAQLEQISDFGLGTNNGLGGELVVIDGHFYLADEHGDVKQLPLSDKTPYATMTKFVPQQQFELKNINSIAELEQAIDKKLSSNNLFYAIKVEGKFPYIKARSIKAPRKPYLPLAQVVKTNQNVFELNNISGTLVIFKAPTFATPMTVPDYHIHFISTDRKKAGHVFDVKINHANIGVMQTHQFELWLPTSPEYTQGNLQPISEHSIRSIESTR